jgi:glutaredoxin 3
MSELLIYTKTGCPYCKEAVEAYQKDGVPFQEINTSVDPEALRFIKETFNACQVPVIVRGTELVQIGFQGGG